MYLYVVQQQHTVVMLAAALALGLRWWSVVGLCRPSVRPSVRPSSEGEGMSALHASRSFLS